MKSFYLFCTSIVCLFPSTATVAERQAVASKTGMVVCVSPAAAEIGAAILHKGGNAVDASVAVAFAMAVTYPLAGNIAGGGFMMVYPGDGKEPTCIEYREMAPASVNKNTFVNEKSTYTHKAVGVPGTVRGMELAHKKFGKLPWKDLVMPAVELAEKGFPLTASMAGSLNAMLGKVGDNPEFKKAFGKADGGKWKAGDLLIQAELGKCLRAIAEEGPDAFYTGKVADLLVAEIERGNGFISKDDLKAYRAVERKPIHGTYRGYDIYGPPPPSSGGICLVEMLNMLEQFPLRELKPSSAEANHLLIEVARRAYLDRARFLGDPDFSKIPAELTSKEHARKLAATIDRKKASPSVSLADAIALAEEKTDTTHFSIVDARGMAVANTYTLEDSYGSRVVVKGGGFLLNNEMGDFNWVPGKTTATGKIGTEANLIAPGKRMLSSQTPTLVTKDGKLVLVTGSPGGRTIINTVLNVVVNTIDFEMEIQQAVNAPRLHHQWLPDEVKIEGIARNPELAKGLNAMGHQIYGKGHTQGDAHSIWIDVKTGTRHGAADRRIDGKAIGQ